MEFEKKDAGKNAQSDVSEKGFGQQNKKADDIGSTQGSGADKYNLGNKDKDADTRRQAGGQSDQSRRTEVPEDQKV